MKSIPEIIIGKPEKDWTSKDVFLIRMDVSWAGGLLWLIIIGMIQILQPRMNISWLLTIATGGIYMLVLYGLSGKVLPEKAPPTTAEKQTGIEKPLEPEPPPSPSESDATEQPVTPSKAEPPVVEKETKRSWVVITASVLEILLGAFLVFIFSLGAHSPMKIINVLWPLTGVLMIVIGTISIIRLPIAYYFNMGVHVLMILSTLPALPEALKYLTRRHNFVNQFGPILFLLLFCILCSLMPFPLSTRR